MTLGTTEQGCLLVTDITGYTKYIGDTEITHAQDVVADLIETIVGIITPTFRISRVEGDAAFAFAPMGSVTPAILMDTVDSTYFAFRERLRDVAHATSCPCQACVRIPSLDLKIFLHEGEYAVRQVAGFTELSGIDVIILHRLTKGTAATVVDGHGYAVYTGALVDVMGWEPGSIGLIPHSETFDDTGRIDVFVQDLEHRWIAEQQRAEVLVSDEDAVHRTSFETEAPPQVVWDHLTDPQKRLEWQTHVTELITTNGVRQQTGTVNHCMHGPDVTIEHIADWRPFSHLSLRYDTAGLTDWLWSFRLDRTDGGTRLIALLSNPGDAEWEQIGAGFSQHLEGMMAALRQVIERADAEA
jgi:uncharacterized protein YndB with AHSA1/START domain